MWEDVKEGQDRDREHRRKEGMNKSQKGGTHSAWHIVLIQRLFEDRMNASIGD